MINLAEYVSIIFILVTVTCFGFMLYASYWAVGKKRSPLAYIASAMMAWLLVTGVLAYKGFFLDFESLPPRLILFIAPLLLVMIALLAYRRTRLSLLKMPLTTLTYVHIIRIPVELCLWWLYGSGLVDKSLTFEGVNFDTWFSLKSLYSIKLLDISI